jgi:multiple sugar transport system substrate-binding protein
MSIALVAAGCTGGTKDKAPSTVGPASRAPVTIDLWIPFSQPREVDTVTAAVDAFQDAYPRITVKITKGKDDDESVIAAIRAGKPPDTVMSFSLDSVAQFCETGAWQDLTSFIDQTGLDLSVFPDSVVQYTSFGGSRCAFPFLTDATGLYYNKDLLEEAGYTEPPKTLSELEDMAVRLTTYNPDGSIKVAGFVPWFGYYMMAPLETAIMFDADYYTDIGAAAIATDPDWKAMFEWQKGFVDRIGADKLKRFVAGRGEEYSEADHDFQTGRLAMAIDGEWRTALIEGGTPDLNYGTAPFPAPDDHPERYGIGRVGGTIMGIPRGSAHPAEAWLLVQFLATDTDALVTAANRLGDVPSTLPSLESPRLALPAQFQTFLDILANPGSHYKQVSTLGAQDQDLVAAFAERWQDGQVTDLDAALQVVAQQIDDQLAQAA